MKPPRRTSYPNQNYAHLGAYHALLYAPKPHSPFTISFCLKFPTANTHREAAVGCSLRPRVGPEIGGSRTRISGAGCAAGLGHAPGRLAGWPVLSSASPLPFPLSPFPHLLLKLRSKKKKIQEQALSLPQALCLS
jgi:hypothetical protein